MSYHDSQMEMTVDEFNSQRQFILVFNIIALAMFVLIFVAAGMYGHVAAVIAIVCINQFIASHLALRALLKKRFPQLTEQQRRRRYEAYRRNAVTS